MPSPSASTSCIFDDLLDRDEHLNVKPGSGRKLGDSRPADLRLSSAPWSEVSRRRPLTSRDVKWTFDSLLQGKIRSTKAAAYRFVDHIDAPDDSTVIFHLKEPFASLLWNLSDGAMGIVPYGSGDEISRNPIGSGPVSFRQRRTG